MVRYILPTLLLTPLAACSSLYTEHPGPNGDALADVVPALEPSDYAVTENCLSTRDYDSVEVVGDRYVLFVNRDNVWVNELSHRCPTLSTSDAITFDLHANRICSLDTVSGIDRRFLGWDRGPMCVLGDFKKVTVAQAALIKAKLNG
jgi:hypothetical protein